MPTANGNVLTLWPEMQRLMTMSGDVIENAQTTGDPFGVNAGLPAYSGAVTQPALLIEVYKQRAAELYLSGQRLEDSRRFNRAFSLTDFSGRNRNFYPYPDQERLNNPNTPPDSEI